MTMACDAPGGHAWSRTAAGDGGEKEQAHPSDGGLDGWQREKEDTSMVENLREPSRTIGPTQCVGNVM